MRNQLKSTLRRAPYERSGRPQRLQQRVRICEPEPPRFLDNTPAPLTGDSDYGHPLRHSTPYPTAGPSGTGMAPAEEDEEESEDSSMDDEDEDGDEDGEAGDEDSDEEVMDAHDDGHGGVAGGTEGDDEDNEDADEDIEVEAEEADNEEEEEEEEKAEVVEEDQLEPEELPEPPHNWRPPRPSTPSPSRRDDDDDAAFHSPERQTADLAAYEDVESPYVPASLTRTPEELNAEADRLLQEISDGLDGSAIYPAPVEHNTPSLPGCDGDGLPSIVVTTPTPSSLISSLSPSAEAQEAAPPSPKPRYTAEDIFGTSDDDDDDDDLSPKTREPATAPEERPASPSRRSPSPSPQAPTERTPSAEVAEVRFGSYHCAPRSS